MESFIYFFIGIIFLIVFVLIMRLVGAWMLRINEIIQNQNLIISELRKANSNKE